MIPVRRYLPVISAIWLSSVALPSAAMVEISDDQMSDVSGAGLAFVFDNFSMRMAPTSFIELTGTAPSPGWERGDARYYGLSITDGVGVGGTDWYGNGCNTGSIAGALACPIGNANPNNNGVTSNVYGIGAAASVYDPYVLRVFQYPGHDYAGNYLTSTANMPTILELVGPSNTDTWRWAFWGELEVGRPNPYVSTPGTCNNATGACGGSGADFLQSQTIIRGKPTTVADINGDGQPEPAILRLMRTTGQGAGNDTLGLTYQSALSGDFRFSVRQTANSDDQLHIVPDFNDVEGMYFKNVDAFLPLGTLHYQAIVLDAAGTDGNFTIELTQIPNTPEIYNHFYCGANNNAAVQGCTVNGSGVITNPNALTHGYVRWGDWTGVNASGTTGANLPGPTSTTNGIYFVGGTPGAETVTNLGISRIEGMLIHSLKITTLGAGI